MLSRIARSGGLVLTVVGIGLVAVSCATDKPARTASSEEPTPARTSGRESVATEQPVPTRAPAVRADDPFLDPREVGSPGTVGAFESLPPAGIYLVPLEDFPLHQLQDIWRHFSETYGLSIATTLPLALTEDVVDVERRQIVSERAADLIAGALPAGHKTSDSIVIALTQYDIQMATKPEWGWVFAYRDYEPGIGIVSTARMDNRNFGLRADDDLMIRRAQKMVARHIGFMYLGLEPSEDPANVLYHTVTSIPALDATGEELDY